MEILFVGSLSIYFLRISLSVLIRARRYDVAKTH